MKRILLIDDEKDFGFFIKENLEFTGGYSVTVATNGKDGISIAMRQKPDLIILDIVMPHMTGFEVLETLKANKDTTTIPVMMLTAVDTDEAKEKALRLYTEDYIVKPVSMLELRTKINAIFARNT